MIAPPPAACLPVTRRKGLFAPGSFTDLPGFGEDNHLEAFAVFASSCTAIVACLPPLRAAMPVSVRLGQIARKALDAGHLSRAEARSFFEAHFRPWRIAGMGEAEAKGFLTGYFEPISEGSLTRTSEFMAPVLGLPDDLNAVSPYYDRETIESKAEQGSGAPLVWLRDRVEVFVAQVQGSARVRLPGGREMRLVYAGRNRQPYSSIGRILIENGAIEEGAMSLAALKQWIRANGQNPGDPGLALMHKNKSYVFFSLEEDLDPYGSPKGGQGIGLTALRSLAIDRAVWSYGLPFWISAELPWCGAFATPFRRLTIAQDIGSAMIGPARCDIFFGSGDDAGARAGDIRHWGEVWVLLPADETLDS